MKLVQWCILLCVEWTIWLGWFASGYCCGNCFNGSKFSLGEYLHEAAGQTHVILGTQITLTPALIITDTWVSLKDFISL